MKREFYHLTTKENADNILKNGLKCDIGSNSKLAEEYDKCIFLCDSKDIPYWYLILNYDTLLSVICEEDDLTNMTYSIYGEYSSKKDIGPECISLIEDDIQVSDYHVESLSLEYLYLMNRICSLSARIYSKNHTAYNKDRLKIGLDSSLTIFFNTCDKLNYLSIDNKKIIDILVYIGGEGDYTFCDIYDCTDKRLWEQLIEYDCEDEMKVNLRKVYDYIKTNLDWCNKVDTGGWMINQ